MTQSASYPWLLAATAPIPDLDAARPSDNGTPGPVTLYEGGNALRWVASAGREVGWSATGDSFVALAAHGCLITAHTSHLNEVPLFIVHDREKVRSLVSTDPFVADRAAGAWGLPSASSDARRDEAARHHAIHRDGRTAFPSVRQLAPGVVARLSADRAPDVRPSDAVDPLADGARPSVADPLRAGTLVLESVDGAVRSALRAHATDDAPVAALLSAGVDSASIVALAARAGARVVAYSVGTPWGDEHAGAADLCAHVGTTHVRVDLAANELVESIPDTVRWLGRAHPEKVDIGLTAMALLRTGAIAEDLVLTGYGSDLINLGLPSVDARRDPVGEVDRLLDSIDDARHGGELSPLHFMACGHRLIHPYWDPVVIRAALDVDCSAKLYRGREKGHLRAAAEDLVTPAVAWRAKTAVHHGGGLQAGLDRIFGGRGAKTEAYASCFEDLVATLNDTSVGYAWAQ